MRFNQQQQQQHPQQQIYRNQVSKQLDPVCPPLNILCQSLCLSSLIGVKYHISMTDTDDSNVTLCHTRSDGCVVERVRQKSATLIVMTSSHDIQSSSL